MTDSVNRSSGGQLGFRPMMAAGLLATTWICAGCSGAVELSSAQQFQQVEDQFAVAQTEEQFAQVAAQYDRILADGVVSGVVLYNRGNAWMRAGDTGRAIASWRQAQRYRPRDPYLAANLQSALSACGSSASVTPAHGVAGYIFFWQNWLSYPEKFRLTTVLLLAVCVCGLCSQLSARRRLLRRLTAVLLAMAVVAVASSLWDWMRFEQTVHGVVTEESTEARKGNAESYETAFNKPLQAGAEFTVLEERADWLNISIDGLGAAWIPASSAVTW